MRTKFLLSFFFFYCLFFFSQRIQGQQNTKIDSIANSIITSDNTDSIKVSKLTKLVASNWFEQHTLRTIHRSEKIAKRSKNQALIADVYRVLGNYYFYNSKLDSAEYFLLKSENSIDIKKYPFLGASTRNSLSGLFRKKGNIPKAIETILESKAILEGVDTLKLLLPKKRKLFSEQLILYNTLANFYNQMGEFQKAINSYDFSYKKAQWLGANKYAGVILSNKGDLLLNMGKNKEALSILKKAKKLKIEGNALQSSITNTEQNIALALLKLNNYNEALKMINQAINYFEKERISSRLMESYVIKGEILLAIKKDYEAVKFCEKAKDLAIQKKIIEIQEKACLCLSKAYENTNDYKNALKNYKLYQNATNIIHNENNVKKITQLEMQYNFDKEKALQKITIRNKEKENKSTIRILILGIISLLLILGLLYRLFYIRHKSNKEFKLKNKQISETLALNETLFKETHHRVKNNLQIIASLLNMQSRYIKDPHSKEIIIESKNRIKSMSLIHQKLYQNENITAIETEVYFNELITSLANSYGIDTQKINLDISIENMLLDIDTALPLGLLLNELISNAFKHGINKHNGYFLLVFHKTDTDSLYIKIKDNGKGIPDNYNWKKPDSYGMKLVDSLLKKLKGTITFTNNNGLEIIILITRYKLV